MIDWHTLPAAPKERTRLLRQDEIPDGGARLLELGPPDAPFRILLLRSGNHVWAYLNRCSHFGVPLAKQEQQLILVPHELVKCNVHYARFSWQEGRCLSGDCGDEGLTPLPVTDEGGTIFLETSQQP